MFAKSILILATAALAVAKPVQKPCKDSVPTLPVNGDHAELPAPPAGLKLKKIALGYGIQNYTCTLKEDGVTIESAAKGALAGLFDITHLYPGQGKDSLDQASFDVLTSLVIETASDNIPLNLFSPPAEERVTGASPGADAVNLFKADAAELPISTLSLNLPHLGKHYFTDKGVPAFELDDGLSFYGQKLDAQAAPNRAAPGSDGVGAVAWLQLGLAEGATGAQSQGVKFVYRVQTGAGNTHGCANGEADLQKSDSSFYTAAYWFYG